MNFLIVGGGLEVSGNTSFWQFLVFPEPSVVEYLGVGEMGVSNFKLVSSSFDDMSAMSDWTAEVDLITNASVADLSCSIVTVRAS